MATLIAILISLGIITSTETQTMTEHEKQELIERNEIVICDTTIF